MYRHIELRSLIRPHYQKLSRVSFGRAILPALLDWLIIVACISISQFSNSYILYIVSIVIIASRQHALLVIAHEASHYHLTKKKWLNDLVANFFIAYPIFFCTNGYRENHSPHHRFLNTDKDPDWIRKIPLKEWQFPQTKREFLSTIIKIFLTSWYKLILLFIALSGVLKKQTWLNSSKRFYAISKIFFYCLAFTVIAKFHWFYGFLAYWLVPYLLIFPLIERIRSISEHFGLERTSELNQARNILCPAWEAFLIGPHHIRFHLDHHLFPWVPQCNLAKLHKILMQNADYASYSQQNNSYFFGKKSVLADILRPK